MILSPYDLHQDEADEVVDEDELRFLPVYQATLYVKMEYGY